MEQAKLTDVYSPERMGIMIGSSRGPLGKRIESLASGTGKVKPSSASDATFGSLTGALAQCFSIRGPGASISATCASAAVAIGLAAEQILLDRADAMLVGGTEAPLEPALLEQLQATGVIGFHEQAEETCRPFDVARNGIVVGEGSAFFVLESAAAAAARGAKSLAQLASWALTIDNCGRTGVNQEGSALLRTMKEALRVADLCPDDIDYINAHGVPGQDSMTRRRRMRWQLCFRESREKSPMHIHQAGDRSLSWTTPALEALVSVEALIHQIIPPTANCSSPDPACDIDVQPLVARPARLSAAMSNSLGFWGYHASLIFRAA